MAQFYTLEEAARVLGMSAEELKTKAQSREVRAFLDGGSWRFRVVDVDELARRRGLGSDAELRLSDLEVPAGGSGSSADDLDLSEFHLGVAKPDLGQETMHFGKATASEGSSEHDILLDDLSLPPNAVTGSSSVIIGVSSSGKHPTDSDVRLVPDNVRGASDSDVRLASPEPRLRQPSDSDVTLIKDDTADHGMMRSSSASDTAVRSSPFAGSSAEIPASHSDSDFDLNPSSELIDALQPDSGSDFELSALDASDEFEATPLSKASDSDVTGADPSISGINLSRPSDSGINLQRAGGLGMGQADSIELAPLSDEEIKTTGPAKAKPAPPKKSLSATPPPATKKGEKDIFDDTDFEVDVPLSDDDSDDKTVQLEAASDFELEESDSGSEVFAIDEEAVDQNAATAMAPSSFAEDEDEDDDGFDAAVSSEMTSGWSSSESSSGGIERSGPAMVLSRESEAEWSGIWVGLLGVSSVLLLLVFFISIDLMRNLYEFRDGGPASGLVKAIAGLFGG
ncbi:MAG: helix-turn-helix domain-containing protein [Isosphaeraceae bacterium]